MPEETPKTEEKVPEVVTRPVVIGTTNPAEGKVAFNGEVELLERKDRKKDSFHTVAILRLPLDKLDGLLGIARATGIGLFVSTVYRDVIRPACIESSSEAIVNGKFSLDKWVEGFLSYFAAPSKRGPRIKELLEELHALTAELQPLYLRYVTLSEPERNRAQQLTLKMGELNAKLQAKGKGQKPA